MQELARIFRAIYVRGSEISPLIHQLKIGVNKMNYSDTEIDRIVRSMTLGTHGGFARALGEAFMLADITNQRIIIKSFSALFSKVASFLDIGE